MGEHVNSRLMTKGKNKEAPHLLLVLTVIPVMTFMFAPKDVWKLVTFALHQFDEIMGTVISLIQRKLGIIHLLLGCYHHCTRK